MRFKVIQANGHEHIIPSSAIQSVVRYPKEGGIMGVNVMTQATSFYLSDESAEKFWKEYGASWWRPNAQMLEECVDATGRKIE